MWKVILVLLLFSVGIWLYIAYRSNPELTVDQQESYRNRRNIGLLCIGVSIGLGIYFYYTGAIKFKATMNGDCDMCKQYIYRHRGLAPYSVSEYNTLKQHANACNVCSNVCFDTVRLLEKNPAEKSQTIRKVKNDCITTTEHAILAKKELGRLENKLRNTQIAAWQTAHKLGKTVLDPFPQVPK